MARLGLGRKWRCLFANDNNEIKARSYRENFHGGSELSTKDVQKLTCADLPPNCILSWASFPCQDLSLAGNGRGLQGERSGVFWPFWHLMESLAKNGKPVPIIVLENVVGLLSSHKGKDIRNLLTRLTSTGYRFGPLIIDAAHFVPQSRPRLFIVCLHKNYSCPPCLQAQRPTAPWHSKRLISVHAGLPEQVKQGWMWLAMPHPPRHKKSFVDLLEHQPQGVKWHTESETKRLLSMMTPINRDKVSKAIRGGGLQVGTVYKRTRPDGLEGRCQRAEVRFDGMCGCLRTPSGGSSRQTILIVQDGIVKSRLLSPRETARIMGVRDNYHLPKKYNEAYHLMGDGLAVPAVSWLERKVLRQLANCVLHR